MGVAKAKAKSRGKEAGKSRQSRKRQSKNAESRELSDFPTLQRKMMGYLYEEAKRRLRVLEPVLKRLEDELQESERTKGRSLSQIQKGREKSKLLQAQIGDICGQKERLVALIDSFDKREQVVKDYLGSCLGILYGREIVKKSGRFYRKSDSGNGGGAGTSVGSGYYHGGVFLNHPQLNYGLYQVGTSTVFYCSGFNFLPGTSASRSSDNVYQRVFYVVFRDGRATDLVTEVPDDWTVDSFTDSDVTPIASDFCFNSLSMVNDLRALQGVETVSGGLLRLDCCHYDHFLSIDGRIESAAALIGKNERAISKPRIWVSEHFCPRTPLFALTYGDVNSSCLGTQFSSRSHAPIDFINPFAPFYSEL